MQYVVWELLMTSGKKVRLELRQKSPKEFAAIVVKGRFRKRTVKLSHEELKALMDMFAEFKAITCQEAA